MKPQIILTALLALTSHTHAANADAMRDLTAQADTGDAAAQLSKNVLSRPAIVVETVR